MAAAEDDLDGAATAFLDAVAHAEAGPRPLDLGRALLGLGAVQRRRREKAAARATLGRAEAVFAAMGHETFASRARDEVTPHRRPCRARGRALRDGGADRAARRHRADECGGRGESSTSAAETVEWNLSKIYRKLGVRSRAERRRAPRANPGDLPGCSPAAARASSQA